MQIYLYICISIKNNTRWNPQERGQEEGRGGERRRGGGGGRMEAPRSPDYARAGAASSNLFFSEPGSRRSSAAHRTGTETSVPEGYSVYFSLLGVLAVVSWARQLAPLIKSFNKRRSRQECTGSSPRRICIFF